MGHREQVEDELVDVSVWLKMMGIQDSFGN